MATDSNQNVAGSIELHESQDNNPSQQHIQSVINNEEKEFKMVINKKCKFFGNGWDTEKPGTFFNVLLFKEKKQSDLQIESIVIDNMVQYNARPTPPNHLNVLRIICGQAHGHKLPETISIKYKHEYIENKTSNIKYNYSDIEWKTENISDIKWCEPNPWPYGGKGLYKGIIPVIADDEIAGIKDRLIYETDEIVIYQEYIRLFASASFPNEENCKYFLKIIHNDSGGNRKDLWNNIDDYELPKETNGYSDYEHNMQLYYCNINNMVYGVNNSTIQNSKTFWFNISDDYYPELAEKLLTPAVLGGNRANSSLFNYENITEPLWICRRYEWIKNHCLYGQDNSFNVFRSLCFAKGNTSQYIGPRVIVSILCIILQIFLTFGICYEVSDNWNIDIMIDNDPIIICLSFLVFIFISFLYYNTVNKFWEFYCNMYYVFDIEWYIIFADFISNILIGLIICIIAFFYLLQSENISDAVLNSFALTFIIELDDLANIFESDENVLIEDDFNNYFTNRWENVDYACRKMKIFIPKKVFIGSIIGVIFSPFFIFIAFVKVLLGIRRHASLKKKWPDNSNDGGIMELIYNS